MTLSSLVAVGQSWTWRWCAAMLAVSGVLRPALKSAARRRQRVSMLLLGLFVVLALAGGILFPSHALGLAAGFVLGLASLHVAVVAIFEGLGRGRVPRIVQDVLLGVGAIVLVMALLSASGVELSSILTTSALLTAVVAFALQDALGNVIGGLAIQLKRPYAVGDWVALEGRPEQYGQVLEINWRATRLLTSDQLLVVVPNATVARSTIVNASQPSRVVRRSFPVSAGYEVPPSRVEEVVMRTLRGVPGVLAEPAPQCLLTCFGESAVEYACRYAIEDFARRDPIASEVGSRLYYEFARAGLSMPYPIRTVLLHERSDEQDARDTERRLARRTERLAAIAFLAPLGSAILKELASRVETVAFGRGESIVQAGTDGSDLFVLERGEVAVRVDAGASWREVARLGAGDFFGEMSLMTGEPRRAHVVALGDVEALRVDKDSFREVLARDPKVVDEIGRALTERASALEAEAAANARPGEGVDARSRVLVDRIRSFFRV